LVVVSLNKERLSLPDTDTVSHAHKFLWGAQIKFAEANEPWKRLKTEDQLSLARQVLRRCEKPLCLSDGPPNVAAIQEPEAISLQIRYSQS
jgi:hypothetical protein